MLASTRGALLHPHVTSSTSSLCQALARDLPGWNKLHDQAAAHTLRDYKQTAQQVRSAVQAEDSKYYQQLADQTATTYSVEGLTGIWKTFFVPFSPRTRTNAMP